VLVIDDCEDSFFVLGFGLSRVAADQKTCYQPDGTETPCGPGHQECSPLGFGRDAPQYHVRDKSCVINDPNGPVYDPVHGVYHLHYQNHVGIDGGRSWGHAVSRDLVRWAHMPNSLWTDRPFDDKAIWSGSATIVDGQVVLAYTGLCHDIPGCGGSNLALAIPANPSDELQTNWTKLNVNPIAKEVSRDPSTAWKTDSGEWRFTHYSGDIYGSKDFKAWYKVADGKSIFGRQECPSLIPLPRTTPGVAVTANGVAAPTHFYKGSHDVADWIRAGTYSDGTSEELPSFTQTPGVNFDEHLMDGGNFYASKDFYDPVQGRRIFWGWIMIGPGAQSLPREVTWHPELQQPIYSPIKELGRLRGAVIGSLEKQTLSAHSSLSLGISKQLGNQSEVIVTWARPSARTRLSVEVMAGSGGGTEFYMMYEPPSTKGSGFVVVGGGLSSNMTLRLLPSDDAIEFHLFVDNTFTEAYFMGGRAVITIETPPHKTADVTVASSAAPVELRSAEAWSINSIWVSQETVRNTPRLHEVAEVAELIV